MRLDKYLLELHPNLTRSKSQDLIKRGLVLVNNKVITKTGYEIKQSDEIQVLDLLKYVCLNKKYYLLKKRAKNIYLIIGEIHKESALFISKAKFPILLHYSSKGYIGRGIVTVIRNTNKEINIPLYKIDTLF